MGGGGVLRLGCRGAILLSAEREFLRYGEYDVVDVVARRIPEDGAGDDTAGDCFPFARAMISDMGRERRRGAMVYLDVRLVGLSSRR